MNRSREHGRLLLEKGQEDLYILERIVDDPQAPDAGVGFHAQQAVEKFLKAALSSRAVDYTRTHDIKRLLTLLRDNGLPLPPEASRLEALTPYGARLRYERAASDAEVQGTLDRAWALACARQTEEWAEALLREQP